MASLPRRLRRQSLRKVGIETSVKSRPYFLLPCGGYRFLTATKGWRRVAGSRLEAQGGLVEIIARCRPSIRSGDVNTHTGTINT